MSLFDRIRAAGAQIFFASFFILLIATISAAQWTVIAWVVLVGLGMSLPWFVHLSAVAGIYLFNRRITSAGRGRRSGSPFRWYSATAFISLFCSAFLLAIWLAFSAADGALTVFAAHALGTAGQATVASSMSDAFRWVATLGMGGIALLMAYGYAFGQHQLRVTRMSIPVLVLFAAAVIYVLMQRKPRIQRDADKRLAALRREKAERGDRNH